MLDAIAEIDNLGMEDSALAADASPTSLDTNAALSESQGSSMQETDFNQSLGDMMSSLDDAPNDTNSSLRIISGQSLEEALADTIPGLDPTTVTPPDPLAEDSSLNPFMMAALSELDNAESLGEAFQTVSDGFESLSDSFERLAASFLAQDSDINSTAIAANGDDASADPEVKNVAIGDAGDDADTNLDTDPVAIDSVSGDDGETHSDAHGETHSDKVAIADDANTNADTVDDADTDVADKIDTDFGIGDLISSNDDIALGTDFNLDFDALKVNVDQVSQGLQFLVQQLEAAFEGDDSALTTSSTSNSLS